MYRSQIASVRPISKKIANSGAKRAWAARRARYFRTRNHLETTTVIAMSTKPDTQRRQFIGQLAGGAAALAGLTFAPPLFASESPLAPRSEGQWDDSWTAKLDGKKFRRQHSIGPYIVDFYCPECRVIVELDGEVHEDVLAREGDERRSKYIENLGIRVIRFENRQVFEDRCDRLRCYRCPSDKRTSRYGTAPRRTWVMAQKSVRT